MKYFNCMTAEQQAIVIDFNSAIREEIDFCVSNLREIDQIGHKGHLPLPATAANGQPVLAGANNHIHSIRTYYVGRLRLAATGLGGESRDLIPEEYQRDAVC